MTENRRQFSRIQFQTEARLSLPHGEWGVEVLDLSLKGALVRADRVLEDSVGNQGTLIVRLDEMGTVIHMEVTVSHQAGKDFGLVCREIDLDSITHLRRLVELNLGDEQLLERELSHLAAD
jgi:hypothetical protein